MPGEPLQSPVRGDERPALFDVEREEPLLGADPSILETQPTGQVAPVRDRPPELASFAFVRRGYDPAEVDAVLLRQRQEMARAVERATTSERQLAEALIRLRKANEQLQEYQITGQAGPPPSIEALGERVTRILREAWDGAEALRAEAAKVAERANAEAQRIAGEAEAEARQRASVIIAQAKEERRVMLAELAARRSEHEAELARLQEQERAVMAHMQHLHAMLQRALSGGSSAPSAGDGGSEQGAPGRGGSGGLGDAPGGAGSSGIGGTPGGGGSGGLGGTPGGGGSGGLGDAPGDGGSGGRGDASGVVGPAEAPPGSAWGSADRTGGLVQSPPGSGWSTTADPGGSAPGGAVPGVNGAASSFRARTDPDDRSAP